MKRYKNRATIRSQTPSNRDVLQNAPRATEPARPAVAPVVASALPQVSQNGESMIGGFMSSVIQGVALGTGSQLASRGVDAIIGPRKIEMSIPTNNDTNCLKEQDAYSYCIRNHNAEDCKSIFEMLSKCKNI